MKIFEADWVCPVSGPVVRNGVLVVDGDTITEVGQSAVHTGERLSFTGCAIVPGFVNAHTHLELTVLRGFIENVDFPAWIRRLTTAKLQHLTQEDTLVSSRLGALECLASGVTTVGEIMDVGTSWKAMQEFGLRGVVYQEVFGPGEDMVSQAFEELVRKIDRFRAEETATLRVGVSPHAPYTVHPELFTKVGSYARSASLGVAIHAAESRDEGVFVREGQGFFADFLRGRGIPVSARGITPIAYLDSLGVVGPETLLVHAIDVEDSDLSILCGRRPRIAHCPKSNLKLGHRIARIRDFLDAQLTVGLGTDSMASNNAVDMFEEMRAAVFLQRTRTGCVDALDAHTALRMATLDAAECLGLSKYVGSLEAGKRADFVVVDLNDPALQPVYDPEATLVFSASRRNIRATFLGGKKVELDPASILEEARKVAARLRASVTL